MTTQKYILFYSKLDGERAPPHARPRKKAYGQGRPCLPKGNTKLRPFTKQEGL